MEDQKLEVKTKQKLVFPVVAIRSGSDFDVVKFEEALNQLSSGEITEEELLEMFPSDEVKTPMLLVRKPKGWNLPEEMLEQLKMANKPIPSISITSSLTGAALTALEKIAAQIVEGHMVGLEIEFEIDQLKFTKTLNYMYLNPDSVNLDNVIELEPVFKCSEEASDEMVQRAKMLNRLASMRIRNNMNSQTVTPSGSIIGQSQEDISAAEDVNPF